MDGSQVTMTVQVSGLSLHLCPRGIRENGHGCNMGFASRHPAQITVYQKGSLGLSVSGPKEVEPLGPSLLLSLGWIFWIRG